MNINEESLEMHEKLKGKIEIRSKVKIENKKDLSLAYTPGVAEPCRHIAKNKSDVYKYTFKGNSVAVISDGSAVLGLGNIGAEASIPVMEGKAVLFKEFANIDAFPICLSSQDVEKNIETIKNIAPVFGGINLEDFKAPECFEIEKRLQDIGIPVMHDDQHGTAVVVLAALINALKVCKKELSNVKIVLSGAGAAGIAIAKILLNEGAKNIIVCDRKGTIYEGREDLKSNKSKKEISEITNKEKLKGSLGDALKNRDIFIGISSKGLVSKEMVSSMNKDSIVMAMANPDPEIMPDDAKAAGAKVIATGRSDFPNQVNNVLAFPGIFRGALDICAKRITEKMKLAAAETLAKIVKNPSPEEILPHVTNKDVVPKVAEAVKKEWLSETS